MYEQPPAIYLQIEIDFKVAAPDHQQISTAPQQHEVTYSQCQHGVNQFFYLSISSKSAAEQQQGWHVF